MRKLTKNIYIHLPFCKKKCSFCDFSIHAIGSKYNQDEDNDLFGNYTQYLTRELDYVLKNYNHMFSEIETIYFGGGTPSLLPEHHIDAILKTINKHVSFSKEIEISLESDPATFNKNKVMAYNSLGINRMTMGIQSLNPDVFKNLNRSHTIQDVFNSLDILKNTFKGGLGVDLIMGLPEQNISDILSDLKYLIAEDIKHISIYMLTLEEKSTMYRFFNEEYKKKSYNEKVADMYTSTYDLLVKMKYESYEISNFCKEGKYSRHNEAYWDGYSEFYGFGNSAASLFMGSRFSNPKSIIKYFNHVDSLYNCKDHLSKIIKENSTSVLDAIKYVLLNNIRRKIGIDIIRINKEFGEIISNYIKEFFSGNRFDLNHEEEYIRIKFPEMALISDEILVDLFIYLEDKIKLNL